MIRPIKIDNGAGGGGGIIIKFSASYILLSQHSEIRDHQFSRLW